MGMIDELHRRSFAFEYTLSTSTSSWFDSYERIVSKAKVKAKTNAF